eukprot:NODE_305_length_10201_cov_0.856464.p11 type:complete len:103 gc:universal NODE_305_length_10201_cov_0.856464:8712-9020(+)
MLVSVIGHISAESSISSANSSKSSCAFISIIFFKKRVLSCSKSMLKISLLKTVIHTPSNLIYLFWIIVVILSTTSNRKLSNLSSWNFNLASKYIDFWRYCKN